VIVTDTVGFIRGLPRDLVAAFLATLEELRDADLLLHVVDAASPEPERRIDAVRAVLDEIGVASTPELLVFNQIDRLAPGVGDAIAVRHGGVAISALTGQGLSELVRRAEAMLHDAERTHREPVGLLAASGGGLSA
jgi:GTPase